MIVKWHTVFVLLLGSVYLSGCATQGDVRNYEYLLIDNVSSQIDRMETKPVSVQLMPIEVANYLTGNEIVLVSNTGEVHRSQLNLWAEPLSPQLTRLTQQRLEKSLPQITWFVRQRLPSYAIAQLSIEVDHFFADLNGLVHITGRWQLLSPEGDLVASQAFDVEDALKKDGYAALTQTLANNWFEQVIATIAQDISKVYQK